MILRSKKIPFMFTGTMGENGFETDKGFARMTNFTEFSVSKNPKEHSSKYIDEDFERSEIVGYATSASYKFDYEPENKVHQTLAKVADDELTGDEAKVTIAVVDFSATSAPAEATLPEGVYPCRVREFSVVPSSEGDDSDIYTYSGTLKAVGAATEGYMQVVDDGTGTFMTNL